MYKVLIVDDEIRICKLIRRIIDWEALGFTIIDEAHDGHKALEMIEELKPDLVLTDIRMPGLDGIGLIKAAREGQTAAEFAILSGYSDFEYARSALDYDAVGYLLKPVDEDKLKEVLQKVKEKITSESTMKERLETSNIRMLEHDLQALIHGTANGVDLDYLNREYMTNFKSGYFCTILFRQDLVMKSMKNNNHLVEFHNDVSEVKDEYETLFHEMVLLNDQSKNQLMLVVNMDKNGSEQIVPIMNIVMRQFNAISHRNNSYGITIGVGKIKKSIKEIGDAYDEALKAVKARAVFGAGKVIDAARISDYIYDVKNIIDVREEKKLISLFDVMDVDSAEAEIAKVFKEASEKHELNLIINHLAGTEIINILYKVMVRKNINIPEDKNMSKDQVLQRLDDCLSKEEMASYIHGVYKTFADYYNAGRNENGSQIISEIKTYVANHYMEDISLDDVAKLVCLNPSYVSGVFRRKSGENFSEYLANYRIEIAKDLLNDVKYRIVDVSYMVGYRDAKYFSRIFKKKVGVNPRDYRKLYLSM